MAETSVNGPYPAYIPRDEQEDEILAVLDRVLETEVSQAVLLYGEGGVGKTWLVRNLAQRAAARPVTWLPPIDLDDPEYWLLTNLQASVAKQLDPNGEYFSKYTEESANAPEPDREIVTPQAVVSHIGHVRQLFLGCYRDYVKGTGKPVVMVFDTVEAIRGMSLLITLTREWMASLPRTLFILAGRPVPSGERAGDPIYEQLMDTHAPMPVTTVRLREFSRASAAKYLSRSEVAAGVTDDDRKKLILLTRGHPLWLALTVSYLSERGVPEEARTALAILEREIPYRGALTAKGRQLHEEFKKRLLSPYRDTDFWHDAILRLAAVRQSVNEPIWRELMSNRDFPASEPGAPTLWEQLMRTPWIRPRANHRYVTLHDAMAEELARTVLSAHDESQRWRHDLWQRAADIYGAQTEDEEQKPTVDSRNARSRDDLASGAGQASAAPDAPAGAPAPSAQEAAEIDAGKREFDQLKASRFFYQLLSDFAVGCRYFLRLFEQATKKQDLLFQDLLATVMSRCLGFGDAPAIFDDAASGAIQGFRRWLAAGQQDLHREIGIALAEFLVASGQAATAVGLLRGVPFDGADPHLVSRQMILLGNAYLRVPGEVKEGLGYLQGALAVADDVALEPAERQRLAATAYKELGFYQRSVGLLDEAETAYAHARDAIEFVLTAGATSADRAEKASIHSNWAYVKGLNGFHQDGLRLVESAIYVRQELGRGSVGNSYSVMGEVYRYQQKFKKAWEAYEKAEKIFESANDQAWLGTIFQQQAICLYQAAHDGETGLVPGEDPLEEAWKRAYRAVEICRERSIRNYPSALNRAGRIIADRNADEGLEFLAEGIIQASAISDGWFLLANLVEYAELSYRTWRMTGDSKYRAEITKYEPHMRQAVSEFEFPDLQGRWEVIVGHLDVHDWWETRDDRQLDSALRHYAEGFRHIADRGHVGSSGAAVIPGMFTPFRDLFHGLPEHVRVEWIDHLRREWSGPGAGSTMLLALLEELY
jgi:tetratricopeptide (TPR) repeat protein